MFQYKHHLTYANKMYRKYTLTGNILPVHKMVMKYLSSENVLMLRITKQQNTSISQ